MKGLTAKENKGVILDVKNTNLLERQGQVEYFARKLAKCRWVMKGYLVFHDVSAYKGKYGEGLNNECKCDICTDARKLLKGVEW